ncbi:MAG: hypothetical protein J0L84_15390 [Verrucomicrobia bacterium]|nr:hypothetical protein [Verrucomicrobiota bacterium]
MADRSQEMTGRAAVMLDFAKAALEQGQFFFYVRIPEDLLPIARGERYEDPLQDALDAEGLGEVTGGGSQLGDGNLIEYCGVDLVVRDRDRGLELIRSVMRRLGAPRTTVIEEHLPRYQERSVYEVDA